MYYPEEVIEEVRSRADIVDVVGKVVHLKKMGANYFGLCPFHGEKTPSFSVKPDDGFFYCFSRSRFSTASDAERAAMS